jgi:ribose transport system substrate-binding protein
VYSAQGSYQAVVNAGLTGAIKIASWDATQELIGALKKGQVDLVLAQKPAEMGSLGVEWAVKYLKDNSVKVPKKVIPGFEFFTKANVNDPAMAQYIYQ